MIEAERLLEVAADDGDVDDRMDQFDHGSTVFCRDGADTPPLQVNELSRLDVKLCGDGIGGDVTDGVFIAAGYDG